MNNFNIREKWLVPENELSVWALIYHDLESGMCPHKPPKATAKEWTDYLKSQRISGIVYGSLKQKDTNSEEYSQIFKALKEDYIRLQSLRKIREDEALAVLTALSEKNIEPVLLKGLYLQTFVYDPDQVRPSSDIDIMIQDEREFEVSVGAVEKLGYRKYVYYSDVWERRFMKSTTMIPDVRGLYFEVDLHRSLLYGRSDKRRIIDRSLMSGECYERKKYLGVPVKVLIPEANFVYMVYHSLEVHHDCRSFVWLLDLIMLSRVEGFDKDRLEKLAQKVGCGNLVKYAVYLISRVMNQGEPKELRLEIEKDYKSRSSREKFQNIEGTWNKVIWLFLWLFPSDKYLKYKFGSDSSMSIRRFKYIMEKMRFLRFGNN